MLVTVRERAKARDAGEGACAHVEKYLCMDTSHYHIHINLILT